MATNGEMARKVLADKNYILEDEQITPLTLYNAFQKILDKYHTEIPEDLHLTLQGFAALLQEGASQEQITKKAINAVAQRMEEQVEATLEKSLNKMSTMVESFVDNQKNLQESTSTISGATEALQKITQDLGNSTREASETSNQLSNTATSYKEALLTVGNKNRQEAQPTVNRAQEDPRLTRDLDRKQRQILLEVSKEYSEAKSVTDLKEKVNAAIANITPPPPEGTKVQEINKLRNGGIVLQLTTKEAAAWLREPSNEAAFIGKLDTDAHIKERAFPILVPRVSLSFDPNNQDNLREVESANGLLPNTLSKARWIKPAYRRHPKQKYAYATLSISSAIEANRLIRDGMYICSARTFPQRLKYEPRQCMKCRKWGHYANECQATNSTCGTCGGEHTTRECDEPGKRYCVSCRTEGHASWDRTCPDFLRKSAQFDEIHPENALTYFPTEEAWTLCARPDRIPLDDRFPAKFAVGLPPVQQKTRPRPNIAANHKQKGQAKGKDAGTQGTLDKFLEPQAATNRPCPLNKDHGEDTQINEEGEIEDNTTNQSSPWSK